MTRPKKPREETPRVEVRGEKQNPSYETLYKRYLTMAARLAEEEVQGFRGDPRIVLVNVKRGVAAVLGTEEQVKAVREHLPKIPVDELQALPNLARALLFASRNVAPRAASPKEIEKALAGISGPREDMLSQADLLSRRGLLDKDRVAQIRAGNGKFDMAEDGIALASLFTEHATALKGQHPFTEEEIEKLRRTSEWLIDNMTPAGARAPSKKTTKHPSEDARDRLWTVTLKRHEQLRKIAYYVHGDAWEEVTPRLMSRVQKGKAAETEDEAASDEGAEENEDGEDAESDDEETEEEKDGEETE